MKCHCVTVAPLLLLIFILVPVNSQVFRPGLGGLPAFINLLRDLNTPCTGTNADSGTCLAEVECTRRQGVNIGPCANGHGTCCSFKFTCAGITRQNGTTFVNPHFPNGENGTSTCQVTIEKQADVCQLRLDFEEFSLSQPDENGQCTTDSFMVRTTVGERLPILCGENEGQHIYIDMGRGSANPVVLSVVSNGNHMIRKWKVKINMISCNHLDMAPSGCMQYFRSPSEIIRSFNYGDRVEGKSRYLSNLRYTSCVRVEENFCAIKWETVTPDSFEWGQPYDSGASGGQCNGDDYIGIDQGSLDGMGVGEDRFCGSRLLDNNVIISRSKPFMLRVRSNADSTLNALNQQRGFALRYIQLPCVI